MERCTRKEGEGEERNLFVSKEKGVDGEGARLRWESEDVRNRKRGSTEKGMGDNCERKEWQRM